MASTEDKWQALEQFLSDFDKGSVSVKRMRCFIPSLIREVFGTFQWSVCPKGWDKNIDFVDPNNGEMVDGKKTKPKIEKLEKVVHYLKDLYQKRKGLANERNIFSSSSHADGLHPLVQDQYKRLKQHISHVRGVMVACNLPVNEEFEKMVKELEHRFEDTQKQPQIYCQAFSRVNLEVESLLSQVILGNVQESVKTPEFTNECKAVTRKIKTTMNSTLSTYLHPSSLVNGTYATASTSSTPVTEGTAQSPDGGPDDLLPPTDSSSSTSIGALVNSQPVNAVPETETDNQIAQVTKKFIATRFYTADPSLEPSPKRSRVEEDTPHTNDFEPVLTKNSPEDPTAHKNAPKNTMGCAPSTQSDNRCAHTFKKSTVSQPTPSMTVPFQLSTSANEHELTFTVPTTTVGSELATNLNISSEFTPSEHSEQTINTNESLEQMTRMKISLEGTTKTEAHSEQNIYVHPEPTNILNSLPDSEPTSSEIAQEQRNMNVSCESDSAIVPSLPPTSMSTHLVDFLTNLESELLIPDKDVTTIGPLPKEIFDTSCNNRREEGKRGEEKSASSNGATDDRRSSVDLDHTYAQDHMEEDVGIPSLCADKPSGEG